MIMDFSKELKVALRDIIQQESMSIASAQLTLEEYRRRGGMIAGLKRSVDVIDEVLTKFNSDED